MPARAKKAPRSEKLDLRLSVAAKKTLKAAADAESKSVSEFVLDSALARAQERLPDRTHFKLSADQWAKFMEALDAPPREHPRLRRLLQEPSVSERSDGR
jgi:uncharacterized protein (DUF1778 family)